MNNCIFCKILNKEIPSKKVFENDYVYAFEDIAPKAPIHILIISKKHIASINDLNDKDEKYLVEIFNAIKLIAKSKNVSEDGYRVITNHGEKAGQSVFHLHFHLLAGTEMKELY